MKKETNISGWVEVFESVVLAVVLALLIRTFLYEPFYIPSPSMQPTLYANDRIIVNKIDYRFHSPERGDVVVFQYPLDPSKDFVKRLVAFGEETVEIRHNRLYINGRRQPEPYLVEEKEPMADFGPYRVPKGCYFMLGDNRNNSEDSRFWGPLAAKYLIGRAVAIYWPLPRMGKIK